jgi:uncharacterized membrane protein
MPARMKVESDVSTLAAKIGYISLALLSVIVAVYSLRFAAVPWDTWLGVGPEIRSVIERVPFQALTHMIAAPIALLVGPFQFLATVRARKPAVHRWLGRIYVAACLIAAVSALATAPFASGGPIAGLGFGILAAAWIAATVGAWNAATKRNFTLHRRLMRYSFAMTFAAVTLRLQIPIGVMYFGFRDYATLSVWLAYTSWIPNVIAVWLYETRFARSVVIPA